MRATKAVNVNHAVFSMLFAVNRYPASLDIEATPGRGGVMRAPLAPYDNHAVLSMLLAVCRRLEAVIDV